MNTIQGLKDRLAVERSILWLVSGALAVFIMAAGITEGKWTYFGLLAAPFLVVIALIRPFLFPLGVYAMLLPFDNILSVTGSGSTLTKYLGVATIVILCSKGIIEGKLKKPDTATKWWILFILYSTASVMWALDPGLIISSFATPVSLLIFYLVVVSYKIDKSEYETLKLLLLLGGVIASVLVCKGFLTGEIHYGGLYRQTISMGEREINPNGLAIDMLFPVSICLERVFNQDSKVVRGASLIAFFILIFGIILTGSRGGLLSVCIIFVVYLLSLQKKFSYSVLIVILVSIVIFFIPDYYVWRIENSVDGKGAGRLDIWLVGWHALSKYWLFGAGDLNFVNAYNEFVDYGISFRGLSRASHNLYLGVFVELGIVGFSLFIMALRSHYYGIRCSSLTNNIDEIMLKAVFWGILIASLFADSLRYKSWWMLWIMILLYKGVACQRFPGYHRVR